VKVLIFFDGLGFDIDLAISIISQINLLINPRVVSVIGILIEDLSFPRINYGGDASSAGQIGLRPPTGVCKSTARDFN